MSAYNYAQHFLSILNKHLTSHYDNYLENKFSWETASLNKHNTVTLIFLGTSQSWARTLYPHTITYMYAHAHHTNTSLLCALLTDKTYFYIWSNRGTKRSWILSMHTIIKYCDQVCRPVVDLGCQERKELNEF